MAARSAAAMSVKLLSVDQATVKPITRAPPRKIAGSYRICGDEAADDDAAPMMHVPYHGFPDRIAAITDDGALRHRHPLAFDRNPVAAVVKIISGTMAIGDVAARHAVRRDDALEPAANVRRDVLELAMIKGKCRTCQRDETGQQRGPCHPSHATLHRFVSSSAAPARKYAEPRHRCMLKV